MTRPCPEAARAAAPRFFALRNRLARSRRFQAWAARLPLMRSVAKTEGEALFDLVAGFCHSQVLRAVVELNLLDDMLETPRTPAALAAKAGLSTDRMTLASPRRDGLGSHRTGRAGGVPHRPPGRAALLGVPGLADMIRHHDILYRDLSDPVAFLRGETEPELAAFWPYVFRRGRRCRPGDKGALFRPHGRQPGARRRGDPARGFVPLRAARHGHRRRHRRVPLRPPRGRARSEGKPSSTCPASPTRPEADSTGQGRGPG